MKIRWKGKGINEQALSKENKVIIQIKKKYFRPAEVDNLKGNYSKAKKFLKWKPTKNINNLIQDMIDYELNDASNAK